MNDVTWIGSRFFLDTAGFYDTYRSRGPRDAWPYDDTRDAGLAEVSTGGGYPTCRQWWADSGDGLRDRLLAQVDPGLLSRLGQWAGFLSQTQADDAVIRAIASPRQQVMNQGHVYTDYGGQIGMTLPQRRHPRRIGCGADGRITRNVSGHGCGASGVAHDPVVPEDGDGHLHSAGADLRHLRLANGGHGDCRAVLAVLRRFLVPARTLDRFHDLERALRLALAAQQLQSADGFEQRLRRHAAEFRDGDDVHHPARLLGRCIDVGRGQDGEHSRRVHHWHDGCEVGGR